MDDETWETEWTSAGVRLEVLEHSNGAPVLTSEPIPERELWRSNSFGAARDQRWRLVEYREVRQRRIIGHAAATTPEPMPEPERQCDNRASTGAQCIHHAYHNGRHEYRDGDDTYYEDTEPERQCDKRASTGAQCIHRVYHNGSHEFHIGPNAY